MAWIVERIERDGTSLASARTILKRDTFGPYDSKREAEEAALKMAAEKPRDAWHYYEAWPRRMRKAP